MEYNLNPCFFAKKIAFILIRTLQRISSVFYRLGKCKNLLLLFLPIAYSTSSYSQNYFSLKGYIYTDGNEPLIGANIRVVNMNVGTTADGEGKYELRLLEGLNRISVSYIGYQTQVFEVVSDKNFVKNIYLAIDQKTLNEVIIRNKKKDFSYEVIKNVIALYNRLH